MEILIVGQSGVDGVGTYINDLAKQMSINHTVWFYGMNPFIKFGTKIKKETTIVPGKYDIAFMNYFKVMPEIDCKKVYHVHNAKIENALLQNIEDVFHYETSFHITYNSDYQLQQLLDLDIDKSFLTEIPNYVNEKVYKVVSNIHKISNSILLLCSIRENNRPIWQPMIKAMKQLPEYRLSIMGSISEKLENEFYEYVKQSKNGNIKYIGEVTDNVVEELEIIEKHGNRKVKTIKKPKLKIKSTKVKTINKYEMGVGVGRSAKEMILCGLPTLVYREGFAGWITEFNIDQLEKDNFTTRLFMEEDESVKIEKIIQAIRSPKKYNRSTAVTKFGLNANFNKYETLMGI